MRTGTKIGVGIAIIIAGVAVWLLGPTVSFLLFHSDWEAVPHLLAIDQPAEPIRLEVIDAAGEVLWAIEKRGGPPVHEIDYGIVPAGFVQLVPAAGTPRDISGGRVVGLSYCDDKGGGAFIQARVRRGEIQHGLMYWGKRNDGTLCDRKFVFDGWTVPRPENESARR
jgi:hypothetical protein